MGDQTLPTAELRRSRRVSLAWLVPVLALAFTAWFVYRAWTLRGVGVIVRLEAGHGLRPGDDVRHLGITVGSVRDVRLAPGLEGVEVVASLQPAAGDLARGGSRFWIVRPELGLDRVAGLETLVGPRYLAVLPGTGPPQRIFDGLAAPPIVRAVEPGDLEIVVEAPERSGLRAGAPVLYRDVQVGTVVSVELSSDGGSVESRLHVDARYAQLVRPDTVFWAVSGLEADLGLTGFSLELQSLQALLVGGVALATPPGAGAPALTGHRFELAPEPPDGWLQWRPMAVIGSDLLPPGATLPSPLRATIGWRRGWLFKGQRSRQGWVLATPAGLLGPADLLVADEEAREGSVELEVAGEMVRLGASPGWRAEGLALLPTSIDSSVWPASRFRAPTTPEDALVVADHASPAPLAAARLATDERGVWAVDPAVPIDERWHGAPVSSRADGAVIGMMLVSADDGRAVIVPVPPELIEAVKR